MNRYDVYWYVQTGRNVYQGVEETKAATEERAGKDVRDKLWRYKFGDLCKTQIEIKQVIKTKHHHL